MTATAMMAVETDDNRSWNCCAEGAELRWFTPAGTEMTAASRLLALLRIMAWPVPSRRGHPRLHPLFRPAAGIALGG